MNHSAKIAVYGTLRYGGSANGLMQGCKYLGKDHVYGKLYNVSWYPALKIGPESEGNKVVVDLYEIPPEIEDFVLSNIDKYEGFVPKQADQSLFSRVKVLTVEGNMEVWVYEYKYDPGRILLIKSGDWFDVSK